MVRNTMALPIIGTIERLTIYGCLGKINMIMFIFREHGISMEKLILDLFG
jgi:hypothetical protein